MDSNDNQRYERVTYRMGWRVREDGDIQTHNGVVPLEEFAASGRIDSVQLEMALEIKRRHLARKGPVSNP